MKLYDLKPGDRFSIKDDDRVFRLEKLEGMYSICYDQDNHIMHIIATIDIIKVIDEEKSYNRVGR